MRVLFVFLQIVRRQELPRLKLPRLVLGLLCRMRGELVNIMGGMQNIMMEFLGIQNGIRFTRRGSEGDFLVWKWTTIACVLGLSAQEEQYGHI